MCSQSAAKLHCQTSLHLSSQSWAILGEGPSISHPLGSRRSSSAPFDVARLYESHPQENLWDICLYYITTSVRGSNIGMIQVWSVAKTCHHFAHVAVLCRALKDTNLMPSQWSHVHEALSWWLLWSSPAKASVIQLQNAKFCATDALPGLKNLEKKNLGLRPKRHGKTCLEGEKSLRPKMVNLRRNGNYKICRNKQAFPKIAEPRHPRNSGKQWTICRSR